MIRRVEVTALMFIVMLAFVACGSSDNDDNALCAFEGSVTCYCENGGFGQQSCSDSGALLPCDCSCEEGEELLCICDDDEISSRSCVAEGYFDVCDCTSPPKNISSTIENGTFVVPWGRYTGTINGEEVEVWLDEDFTVQGTFIAWESGDATLWYTCNQPPY